jgi:hypothetical protein
MNLIWHQLKKDLLRTRWLVGLWLFFALLQFSLAGASANPSDAGRQMLLSMLGMFTSMLGSLLVMIIVPLVIQQEPLVGTTAFWLTRPISRRLLLAEKALFLCGLILLPLLVQSVVMLANGVTFSDTFLAAPEFIMGEVGWFITMAMLAVLTPSFGRFVIACALYLVFLLVCVYLFQVFRVIGGSLFASELPSLTVSRGFVSGVIVILFGSAVVLCQFFWRRFRLALALAIVGVAASSLISQLWPWNFFQPPPQLRPDPTFDAATIFLKPQGAITSREQVNLRGAEPDKLYDTSFDTSGGAPGFLLTPQKFDVTLTTASGERIPVKPPTANYFFNNSLDAGLLRPVLGDVPVVNLTSNLYFDWSLFTVSNATYQHYAHAPAKLSMQAHLLASKYVATVELPIRKGAEFRRGSYREVITEVLHETDGVDILLQVQDVRLNYHLRPDQDNITSYQMNGGGVIYLLVNRQRHEAIMQKQNNGLNVNFNVSEALQHTSKRVAFGPDGNNSANDWTFPQIDDAWLRDAVLLRIELQPVAEIVKPIVVGNFRLDGQYDSPGQRFEPHTPDLDVLAKITLPPDATRSQVRDYIAAIIAASQGATGAIDDHDPQVGMLEKVGAENVDLLAAAARDTHNYYLNRAIDHLAQPDQKALVIADLPTNVDLLSTVVHHGWQADARDVLIAGLNANRGDPDLPRTGNQPFPYIGPEWIKAVAGFKDPTTYPALHDYFVNHADAFTYQVLKTLAGFDSAGALRDAWAKAQSNTNREMWRVGNLLPLAAQAGYSDLPATLLRLLSDRSQRFPYPRQEARRVARNYTPAIGKTDEELAAWLKDNAAKLVFDPAQKKYVLPAAAPAPTIPAAPH